jgi:hypothetical protein
MESARLRLGFSASTNPTMSQPVSPASMTINSQLAWSPARCRQNLILECQR